MAPLALATILALLSWWTLRLTQRMAAEQVALERVVAAARSTNAQARQARATLAEVAANAAEVRRRMAAAAEPAPGPKGPNQPSGRG